MLVGKYERNRPLRRPKRRREGNIKMYLKEIGQGCVLNSTGLGWDPVAGSCERG